MRKVQTIAFCGIDGSGKSKGIKTAQELFADHGISVAANKMSYSPLEYYNKSMLIDLILQLTSGAEIVKHFCWQKIAYNNYDFILHDRHMLCYLAYAMAYDVKNIELIKKILDLIAIPDLILYFDVDAETSIERINRRHIKKGTQISVHETTESLKLIKSCYEYLLPYYQNVEIIDANLSIPETSKQLEDVLIRRYIN